MREVIFRGKRLDNGQWIYGDLYHRRICGVVSPTIHNIEYTGGSVDPATVGQYTGLTDKNGKQIFEGDILSFNPQRFSNKVVVWYDKNAAFYLSNDIDPTPHTLAPILEAEIDKYAIIGNIYDNPDLIPVI